jgi:hypothetical protein
MNSEDLLEIRNFELDQRVGAWSLNKPVKLAWRSLMVGRTAKVEISARLELLLIGRELSVLDPIFVRLESAFCQTFILHC